MRFGLLPIIFCFLYFSAFAQNKEAQKDGELPSYWECDNVIAVTDNFLLNLQNNPQSTGFVIFYEGKYADDVEKSKPKMLLPRRGEANFRVQIIRNHIKFRNFDPDRILFIDGGFREEHKIEYWIVPDGAKLPKPAPTLDNIEYRKGKPRWRCDI